VRVHLSLTLLFALLSGCATLPPSGDTPQLPPSVFGMYEDNDVGAINLASWAFASPGRTQNNPIDAAKAVISVEYLAGELRASPRWVSMSFVVKQQMVEARADLRRVLGIRPDAPPQLVVNVLLQVIGALQAGDQSAALQALAAPGFTFAPPQTMAVLSNLPYVPTANYASSGAAAGMFSPGNNRW
jgi:hypothetical protein